MLAALTSKTSWGRHPIRHPRIDTADAGRGAHVMHACMRAFCDIGHLPRRRTPSSNQPGRLQQRWPFRGWSWCRAAAGRRHAAACRDCSIRLCRTNGDHGSLEERLVSDRWTRNKVSKPTGSSRGWRAVRAAVVRRRVDHEQEALLGGGKLGDVMLRMRTANMLLHGAVSLFLQGEARH